MRPEDRYVITDLPINRKGHMSTLAERITAVEKRQERVEAFVNQTIVQIGDTDEALQFCIDSEIVCSFEYVKPTGKTRMAGLIGQGFVAERRQISAYAITESGKGDLLVVGYDHDRDDIRQFRVDRIVDRVDPDLTIDYVEPVKD